MLQGVSYYLNIKPFAPLSDGKSRKTTMTTFDETLKEEKIAKQAEKESEKAEDTAATVDTDTKKTADNTIIYKDPLTGKKVIYEDVAALPASEKTVSHTQNMETVDSMRKTKYDAYFKEAAKKYNVSESLLKAIAKAESNFNPNDVSSSGAMGIMQLMPATAKELGVKDAFDPEQNIMGGAKCISQKLKEFNGNISLALAAYNAGSGAVKRNGGVPSYCKTYVSKVLSYKSAFETATAVG